MACFFKKAAAFLKRTNITLHRRYDTEGAVYTADDKETPKFAYAVKGSYKISLWRAIACCATALSFLLTLKSIRGIRKLRRANRRRKVGKK